MVEKLYIVLKFWGEWDFKFKDMERWDEVCMLLRLDGFIGGYNVYFRG